MRKTGLVLILTALFLVFVTAALAAVPVIPAELPDYKSWSLVKFNVPTKFYAEKVPPADSNVYADGEDIKLNNTVEEVYSQALNNPLLIIWRQVIGRDGKGEPDKVRIRIYLLDKNQVGYKLIKDSEVAGKMDFSLPLLPF